MDVSHDLFLTREWIEALILLAVALVGIWVLKYLLSKFRLKPNTRFVAELIPYILNLGYVVALSIFLHAAPFSPRVSIWVEQITYVAVVLFFLILVRRCLLLITEWTTHRAGASAALQQGFNPLLRNIATLFVFITGSVMILKHFGYDVMSLLAALGVGSLAVGLAAKEALSNMISGFVLIMDRNLRQGDRISLGGVVGDVEEIGLRSTRIYTGDGNTLIVPNFDLVNNRITNYSMPSRASTATTQIRVSVTADFDRVKSLSLKILSGIPHVDQSKSAWVNLVSLSEGYQLVGIGCWLRDMDDSGDVLTMFHKQLLAALKAEGVPLVENSWFAKP